MKLKQILENLEVLEIIGKENIEINSVCYDSRKIEKGSLFIAILGYENDGHQFIDTAIENGAVCIVVDEEGKYEIKQGITYIVVKNSRKQMAIIAKNFYGNPDKDLKIIGITGTKGKTTTTYMIKQILEDASKKVGLIGTIYNIIGNKVEEASRSCPESLDLYKMFRQMVDEKIEYVVMEVTSHALDLYRVHGIQFAVGVFTNLSQDHLDYHETMDKYFEAKAKLFKQCDFAVVNGDDIYSQKLIKGLECKYGTFGLDNDVNITARDITINSEFVSFRMFLNGSQQILKIGIPGRFTIYNALAAIGVCSVLGIALTDVITGLVKVKVPGRSEIVDIDREYTVMIDFAHSPASLEGILNATKKYAKGRIICVFGCGGDRDRTKRPIMGEISGKLADFTIITSDNPRTENPEDIVIEVENGIKKTNGLYKIIVDRREAIKFAMTIAWKNDIVLLCGKGHETYQIIGKEKIHMDEREIVRELLNEIPKK